MVSYSGCSLRAAEILFRYDHEREPPAFSTSRQNLAVFPWERPFMFRAVAAAEWLAETRACLAAPGTLAVYYVLHLRHQRRRTVYPTVSLMTRVLLTTRVCV